MIGVHDIATVTPSGQRDVQAMAKRLGVDSDFLRDKLGVVRLPVIDEGTDTDDLALSPIQTLLNRNGKLADQISLLIVVTQNPAGDGLPHTAARLQHAADLSNRIAAFDVSLGCSGYTYCLPLATRFLDGQPDGEQYGLLVTADPYSKIVDPSDRDTALLFGDAATATLLGPGGRYQLGTADFMTSGRHANAIPVNRRSIVHEWTRRVQFCDAKRSCTD